MELMEEDSVKKAIAGSDYVCHLASPYYLDNQTKEELIGPCVNGTLSVMKACSAATVKRCVITSSYAAIRWTAEEDSPKDGVYDESHWSNPERAGGIGDYAEAKTLQEHAAWDYQKSQNDPFELVALNPTLMLGPGITDPNVVSAELIRSILKD